MDAQEILNALRVMRDNYSLSCPADERNYPGMERDDMANHMAEDAAAEQMRSEIHNDLDRLIARIEGTRAA